MPKLVHKAKIAFRDGGDLDARNAKIFELYRGGLPPYLIAKRMQLSAQTVRVTIWKAKREGALR